jgi:hypothetical protein
MQRSYVKYTEETNATRRQLCRLHGFLRLTSDLLLVSSVSTRTRGLLGRGESRVVSTTMFDCWHHPARKATL